jgi:hypothetical protein
MPACTSSPSPLSREAARAIVGNQPAQCIRNMRQALELMTWRNYPDDWQRLEACYVLLNVPRAKRLQTRDASGSWRSK